PTASAISGRTVREAGAPSSWRPPWLEPIRPSTPCSTARRASATERTPFTRSGPDQSERNQARSSQPTEGSIWRLATPPRVTRSARSAPGAQVGQREARTEEDPADPARPTQGVDGVPHGDPGRDGEAVSHVALAGRGD